MSLPELIANVFERETALSRWYRAQCEHAHISIKPTLFHFAYTRELFFARCAALLHDHAGTHVEPSGSTLFAASFTGHASAFLGTQAILKSALAKEESFLHELEAWSRQAEADTPTPPPEHQPFLELLRESYHDTRSRIAQLQLLARRLL